ncbi:MAG: cyclic nucleotide-binding domain-containing protein [Geminicoccaceae bacterium]|nr:cyclic nucleotide-binding domain-containing protein [Geminicoccaceae bacterium]MCX8102345.1 cyclic nucleotide-binding domain-containing protein [Geminicoccaceae bacterium]MDW8369851.1 cyclic nucleotide-binding domain-containing protein [Geminicoccaceae bacterium]
MIERSLAPGEILFAEGEPAELVGRIESGLLEVVKRTGGEEIVLARLGPGEHVGEMGVLEGRPRAATVRALEPARVRLASREAFLEQLAADPGLAHRLLVSLSERLHRADLALAGAVPGPSPTPVAAAGVRASGEPPALRLLPGSPALAAVLPAEGIAIEHLPFSVGRRPAEGEAPPRRPVDLLLEDTEPYRLSRLHFHLERARDGVAVVDATSTLGTLVDEVPLGEPFAASRVVLGKGEHRIVAGGMGSPFVFRLIVG